MGDSLRMNPRETATIQRQQREALATASSDAARFITKWIATSMANLQVVDLALPDDFPEDQEMGQYKDDMD